MNSNGKGKTFVYRFDIDTSFNKFKLFEKSVADYPGASHADDLMYLFSNMLGADISIESEEFAAVKKMV
jgi:carboxylesterase type B